MTRHRIKLENLPKVVQLLADKGAKIEIWNQKNQLCPSVCVTKRFEAGGLVCLTFAAESLS